MQMCICVLKTLKNAINFVIMSWKPNPFNIDYGEAQ